MATKIELVNQAHAEILKAQYGPTKWVKTIHDNLLYNYAITPNFNSQMALWLAVHAPGDPPPPSAFANPALHEAYIQMAAAYWDPHRWVATIRSGWKGQPYNYELTRNWKAQVALYESRVAQPGPQPTPLPPTEHFPIVQSKTASRSGLYFYDYPNSNVNETTLIRLCKQYNMYIALLVHEIDRAPIPDFNANETRKRYQDQGIIVVATGWLDSHVDLHAQADAINRFSQGYDEYWGNMEASWKFDADPVGFMKMGDMAPLMRQALGPDMPLGVSCEWGQQSWWRPLLEAGISSVNPQCYMDQWPHMIPRDALVRARWGQNDLPQGLPLTVAVRPTYGIQRSSSPPLSNWSSYDDEIGRPPKSAWNARHCWQRDIEWLARR